MTIIINIPKNQRAEIFSFIGAAIYLELIELNFCDLNHNLKKNIDMRSLIEALDINQEETNKYSPINKKEKEER